MSRSDDMTALRAQVQAGHLDRRTERRSRADFVSNLTQSGIALGQANQAANRERRRSVTETLSTYIKRLLACEKNRLQEAGRLHQTRVNFVAHLAETTAAQRKANATENAAARRGWLGLAS